MKFLIEQCQKININELCRESKRELIALRLKSKIEAMGLEISLTSSACNFGGERFWFICPSCGRRAGTLYLPPLTRKLSCRKCNNLTYLKSRYHKMI